MLAVKEEAPLPSFGLGGGAVGGQAPGADADWFRAETFGRVEMEQRAVRSLRAITGGVDQLWRAGLCPSRRWTNDREECDPPGLPEEVVDFPAADTSLFVPFSLPRLATPVSRPAPGDQVEVLREKRGGFFDPARLGTRGARGRVVREDGQTQGLPPFQVELSGGPLLWYERGWLALDRGRPLMGDGVVVYVENIPERFDPQRQGTQGLLGTVVADRGIGAGALDVAFPGGRVLQYDDDWVAKAGRLPRVGDAVVVMAENPPERLDDPGAGAQGCVGTVVAEVNSDTPFLVRFRDGAATYLAEERIRKVPPERLRLVLRVPSEDVPDDALGDFFLCPGLDALGFPVWVKDASTVAAGGQGRATPKVQHVLHTDPKGRWAVTRLPEHLVLLVSRPHGGRLPQLLDQWGLIRRGVFVNIDFVVQAGGAEDIPPPVSLAVAGGDVQERSHRKSLKTRRWARLVEYGPTSGPGCSGGCSLFDKSAHKTHCGRVFQSCLDNAYFVEALNAITLRPKLARRLFHGWSIDFSVYAVRLFKNATWTCVEVDDWVPVRDAMEDTDVDHPFCCYSEHFPGVLWPSLVEKAYAKACTIRDHGVGADAASTGGWEAVGGGGRVDEALVDLTGGVASSFSTRDVSPDRLFVYLHELQRDCLFVCRVHIERCIRNGVTLNPQAHYAVNRAAHHEGQCFVQMFCAHPSGVNSGGLDGLPIPEALLAGYPEVLADGFFWLSIYDFHHYFDTIFECRLVNSPDVGIVGMPPSRLARAREPAVGAPLAPDLKAAPGGAPVAGRPLRGPPGEQPVFFESVLATGGVVTERQPPEFDVRLPSGRCEVVATVEQTCSRIMQVGAQPERHAAVLLKVYEHVHGDAYSSQMVCKSNWMPVRGAMVAFTSLRGGRFKVMAEMREGDSCDRLVFRCYASEPAAAVTASAAAAGRRRHALVEPRGPPSAVKGTFVGCPDPAAVRRADLPMEPEDDLDSLRRQSEEERCCLM